MNYKKTIITIVLILGMLVQLSVFIVPLSILEGYFTILKPTVWFIILAFVVIFFEKNKKPYPDKGVLTYLAILGIVIYVLGLFVSGFYLKYSYNPMNTTLTGLMKNFWIYIPIIMIREYVRSRIMQATTKKNKYYILIIVAIVFTFLSLDNIRNIYNFGLGRGLDYLLTIVLPLLLLNLFLTYAALKGAMESNCLFQFVYVGIPLFSPVLPNSPKIYEAIILYTTLFIIYIIYDKVLYDRNKEKNNLTIPDKYHLKWLIAPGVVLTFLILFALGAFPYMPVAVASNSMSPEFNRGDVVLVRKSDNIDVKNIEIGKIIQYRTEKNSVVHRITDTYENVNGTNYVTKGDHNNVIDATPIREEQVMGVVEYKIPYIGWPTLIFGNLK